MSNSNNLIWVITAISSSNLLLGLKNITCKIWIHSVFLWSH
jgi:hypothetical protein